MIKIKQTALLAFVVLVLGQLAVCWCPVKADDLTAGILGCVWKYGGVYAAPSGTMVYGKNVSTGTVYCTEINHQYWGTCLDPNNDYAYYVLNHNNEWTGIFASGSCTYWQTAMPCGTYDVWAEDPVGHVSPKHGVDWTGNCTSYNVRQDLVLSNTIQK